MFGGHEAERGSVLWSSFSDGKVTCTNPQCKAEVERINCERGFKIDEEIIEYYRGVPLQGKD